MVLSPLEFPLVQIVKDFNTAVAWRIPRLRAVHWPAKKIQGWARTAWDPSTDQMNAFYGSFLYYVLVDMYRDKGCYH